MGRCVALFHALLRIAVLVAHIVDLNIDQLTVFQRSLDHIAVAVGVHMYLDNIAVVHHHDAVADGLQVRPQPQRILLRGVAIFFNQKF